MMIRRAIGGTATVVRRGMSTWQYFSGEPEVTKSGVAMIRLENKGQKMNTLSEGLQMEMEKLWMDHVVANDAIKAAVFVSGKPDNFIAGADIGMLKAKKAAGDEDSLEAACLEGHALFDRLRRAKKIPTVAAIHGACLGGGLEWALKCDARVATTSPKTKLGLPEVKLGLLPGWGGTSALPKLIGITTALPLILQGTELRSDKARKLGVVDYVCDAPSLEPLAEKVALDLANKQRPKRKRSYIDLLIRYVPPLRRYVFDQAKKKVDETTRGKYPAAYEILKCVEHGCVNNDDAAWKHEAQAFVRLAKTSTSTALIGLFDGLTEAKKAPAARDFAGGVSVVGAGLMGAGIAQVTAEKGVPVILNDVSRQGLQNGIDYIAGNLAKKVKRKRLTDYERNAIVSRVAGYAEENDGAALARRLQNADVVIEAVVERLDVKHAVFRDVARAAPRAILATNTSAIPIADVAKGVDAPERVVGMHYFSPVPQMQLLEIIPHATTARATVDVAVALGIKQGKTCVVVKDVPGFYVNRALSPMLAEVGPLFSDGVDPMALDEAVLALGMPVGPCALLDEVGADVAFHVQKTMIADATMGQRMLGADPTMLETIVGKQWLGRKTGKGFFVYKKGNKAKEPHKQAHDWIRTNLKTRDLQLDAAEIQDRFVSRFVNECAVCLQEDIIKSPVDGDLGAVFGIGFLPFTGGPFRMLDHVGVQSYVDKMDKLAEKYDSPRFEPCQLLRDKAKAGATFYSASSSSSS